MEEKKTSGVKQTECQDKSFLWWKWKKHSWKRVNLPFSMGRFDSQIGIENNCVFFRKNEFDDGVHGIFWLYQVATCSCGKIKLIPTSHWTAFRIPFDSEEKALSYVKELIEKENK